jgi:zinc/manganese transport system substrate-binding protein
MYFVRSLGLLVALCFAASAQAAEKIRIVASFSILGDMVKNIAGDAAELIVLVGPNADTHVYSPTPQDVKTIAAADLVIVSGIGFEGWMERLVAASGYKGKLVVATQGIALAGEQESDPHAWQNVANGMAYVANIRDALMAADPDHADNYRKNADAYTRKLQKLDAWVKAEIAKVPADKRQVITSHDAFGHFAKAYGVEFLAPQGVSTESDAAAGDIARLIDQIRVGRVKALFMENISDKRFIEQLAGDGGAYIGGSLYSDALSPLGGPADSYLKMFDNNVKLLVAGMLHNR